MCIDFVEFVYLFIFNGCIALHFVEYMIEKLGIQKDKVPELCVSLYKIYGTTMAGLKVNYI
jgi:hypothetical protein